MTNQHFNNANSNAKNFPLDQSIENEKPAAGRHATVVVEHGDLREEIDVNIAPLILEIWKAGIKTMMSCQETDPGMAWIEFDSPEDLLRFLNIITCHDVGVDTLYNRVNQELVGDRSLPSWEYQVNLLDLCGDTDEQAEIGIVEFEMTIGAYFPHADIPVLLERLASFNELLNA